MEEISSKINPRIVTAQSLENYRFDGGVSKVERENLFKQVRGSFGIIEWPGGIDLDFVWRKSYH